MSYTIAGFRPRDCTSPKKERQSPDFFCDNPEQQLPPKNRYMHEVRMISPMISAMRVTSSILHLSCLVVRFVVRKPLSILLWMPMSSAPRMGSQRKTCCHRARETMFKKSEKEVKSVA